MDFKIQTKQTKQDCIYILDDDKKLVQLTDLTKEELAFIKTSLLAEQTIITINRFAYFIFIYLLKNKKTEAQTNDACRKTGAELAAICNKQKLSEIK